MNLLAALDALLAEGSVTRAARRLGLSASAMSRTLARLRAATGDPLLVRAGRGLVPTPRAVELRDPVHALCRDVSAVLRPRLARLDMAALERTFTLRTSEGFVEFLAAPLVAAVMQAAPRARLHFLPKPDKDAAPLRDGLVDLEIGARTVAAPEVRTRFLFRDGFVGVARSDHPLLAGPDITPERYAAFDHVAASRNDDFAGPVDQALAERGLRRTIRVVVPGYPDAMRIARQSDLLALVPRSCLGHGMTGDPPVPAGLAAFELPVPAPALTILAMWHPRLDADPAHRWLRDIVMAVCQQVYPRQ